LQTHIVVESAIEESPRVAQVRGIFDLTPEKTSRLEWDVSLPIEEKPWSIGLIVGPSGCGKSTIARRLWPTPCSRSASLEWPSSTSVLDAFPASSGVKEIVALLSSVGFSSPPAWLRPFHVLSTGQQFRVTLARLMAEALPFDNHGSYIDPQTAYWNPEPPGPIVFDEYTSVVDRTVAQVGSAAVSKVIRQHGLQFIAVTCHEDVEPWLNPDWVYRPAERTFAWRELRRRPDIALTLFRCHQSAWGLFAPHHYLSHEINPASVCFLATWQDRPVSFSAWLPFVGTGPATRREHRTVCLPDYQGVGVGNAISDTIASLWRGLGFRATSTTTHPAMIRSRLASPNWRLTRAPAYAIGLPRPGGGTAQATDRLTAGFEYVGPRMNTSLARMILGK
jgi:energy-coupling factor transporter ATP-binding protein EcfA2